MSASGRKLGSRRSESSRTTRTNERDTNVTGYRFVDMELLTEAFQQMPCIECGNFCLALEDNQFERNGCASLLRLHCKECGWVYCFRTSKNVQHYFDINRRFVYAMRGIGQGEASAKRFCAHMNMTPPPNRNAYNACNVALSKAVKDVAMETMEEAGKEVHLLKQVDADELGQCAVSCDGTWQRRGHSSLNGCVTYHIINGHRQMP